MQRLIPDWLKSTSRDFLLPHFRSLFLVVQLCFPLIAQAIVDEDVEVDYRDGLYLAHLHGAVNAASETVLEVFLDFDHMAQFVPGLTESHIVMHRGNRYQVAQKGKVTLGPFALPFESLRQIDVIDGARIVSVGMGGSARQLKSEMRLTANSARTTEFDYRLEMVPENWVPSGLGGNFVRHQLAVQFNALIAEMLRRQRQADIARSRQPGSGQ